MIFAKFRLLADCRMIDNKENTSYCLSIIFSFTHQEDISIEGKILADNLTYI